ncbi:MAG: peptidoglycan bridge formation glycyltransferase FemA/FemB family protein [Candidatus Peribacteraceae bacterium]|nr:peptidoglycan bridge formation glycyltransferase FemA/FemB family protein [Candidatus Peribacteraceae bacterium]
MTIQQATNQQQWDDFLMRQRFSPFLQSWTMGEVYRETGQEPIRLEVREGGEVRGICMAITVHARRGKHLAVPYGPVLAEGTSPTGIVEHLECIAREQHCLFIRLSPFWPAEEEIGVPGVVPAPLHLLAEHIWYLPLKAGTPWQGKEEGTPIDQEELMKNMRQNTRNLIRRAEREGVIVARSEDPMRDLPHFIRLHEETRKRHHFTPYSNSFFAAQVQHFAAHNECTLYLARYQGEVIAASIHMHMGGETSYHHGASTHAYQKIPASYLLQWTAICDAIKRGDHTYSFWGIAPEGITKHPFAGVTLFKRGFGGELLELTHCMDIPMTKKYHVTRAFELMRKWRRGF